MCECGCGLPTKPGKRFLKGHNRRGCCPVNSFPPGNDLGNKFKRGHTLGFRLGQQPRLTHGMTDSREYTSFESAKSRCENLNDIGYSNYGGRGIKFLFTSFEQFYAELGTRPEDTSIDRIDNDGNYEPGNCRWATASEQQKNKRKNFATS